MASTNDREIEARESVSEGDESALSTGQAGSVAFPQLVQAHFQWQQSQTPDKEHEHPKPNEALEKRFRDKLKEFQKAEGDLKHVYWATRRPSAVALTMRKRGWFVSFLMDGDTDNRLHRVTDWMARERRIAELMHHADTLAIKVSEVLRGTPERIAMQWLYAVQSHLLGFVERTQGRATPQEITELVDAQENELLQIEAYYARAGEQTARIVYFWGMMFGAIVDGGLAVLLGLLLWATGWFGNGHASDIEFFFICYVSGGLGAIISVLTRMSTRNFHQDYEVGRTTIRRLGSFRPFIGGVFGIAIFFLIKSGIPQMRVPTDNTQSFFFFAIIAFLAGFNERWTRVTLTNAQTTLAASMGGSGGGEDQPSDETQNKPPGGHRRKPDGGARDTPTGL